MTRILPAVIDGEIEDLLEVKAMDEGVDLLHGRIVTYLGRLSQEKLSETVSRELLSIMEAANDLEAVGDIIETNLVVQGLQRLEEGVVISEATQDVLKDFQKTILRGVRSGPSGCEPTESGGSRSGGGDEGGGEPDGGSGLPP